MERKNRIFFDNPEKEPTRRPNVMAPIPGCQMRAYGAGSLRQT
jgi:hypothetical protein